MQSFLIHSLDTVNHFIFACSLFRDFQVVSLFAEIEIRDGRRFPM